MARLNKGNNDICSGDCIVCVNREEDGCVNIEVDKFSPISKSEAYSLLVTGDYPNTSIPLSGVNREIVTNFLLGNPPNKIPVEIIGNPLREYIGVPASREACIINTKLDNSFVCGKVNLKYDISMVLCDTIPNPVSCEDSIVKTTVSADDNVKIKVESIDRGINKCIGICGCGNEANLVVNIYGNKSYICEKCLEALVKCSTNVLE